MQEYSRTQSTKSTGFYGLNHKLQCSYPCFSTPQYSSSTKSQYCNLDSKQDKQNKLQTKVSTLVNYLNKVKELNKKLSNDKNREQQKQQHVIKYQQILNTNKQFQKDIKQKINETNCNTEKQIEQLMNKKIEFIKKNDQNVKNIIIDLRQLKNKYLNETINEQHHTKLQQIKNKANKLKKQAIAYKKQSNVLKKDIFQMLSIARTQLHLSINQEEIQRNKYNKTIQNLMEVSCGKAEHALRRRIY